MYKLLLVTDNAPLKDLLFEQVDWHALGFHRPNLACNAQEAVAALESKVIDAVGFQLTGEDQKQLTRYLRYGRPSMPLFKVEMNAEAQSAVMKELLRVMDKLRTDDADAYYDQETVLNHVRDEFVHQLLCGEIEDYGRVERTLAYIRARIDPEKMLVLYDIDMPQGEIYMQEHNDPARRQHRLERALRNNFFGRYVDGVYYAVAVLNPRHIRLAALQAEGASEMDAAFIDRANAHVNQTIEMVKNYLELDMNIENICTLDSMRELVRI